MKTYAACPCCSNRLIHHIGNHRDYWFCRRCWSEMPAIDKHYISEIELSRKPHFTTHSLTSLIESNSSKLGIV